MDNRMDVLLTNILAFDIKTKLLRYDTLILYHMTIDQLPEMRLSVSGYYPKMIIRIPGKSAQQ